MPVTAAKLHADVGVPFPQSGTSIDASRFQLCAGSYVDEPTCVPKPSVATVPAVSMSSRKPRSARIVFPPVGQSLPRIVRTPAVQYQYFKRYCCPFGALFGGQLIPTVQIPVGVLQVIVQVPAELPEVHRFVPNVHPVPVQPVTVMGTEVSA